MTKHNKFILIGVSLALAMGVVICTTNVSRKRKIFFQRQEVADEGYETAQDILFPMKSQQLKRIKRKIV